MQFKALEYLEAVYHYKNFTKAAEALFVSQPAISAAIRKLEEEFNVKLITRTPKKVLFTPEGEGFATKIIPILEELRTLEKDMLAKGSNKKQILRLGLSPTAPADIVHKIYQVFLPSLSENEEVFFDEGGAYYHLAKIAAGEIDVAINVLPEDISNFAVSSIPLYQQEICLLIREDSVLAQYDKIPIQLLNSTPITSLGASSYLPKRLEMEAAKRNIRLKVASKHLHQTSYIEEILLGGSSGIINVDSNNMSRALYAHKALVTRPFLEPMYLEIGILYSREKHPQPLTQKILNFIAASAKLEGHQNPENKLFF